MVSSTKLFAGLKEIKIAFTDKAPGVEKAMKESKIPFDLAVLPP